MYKAVMTLDSTVTTSETSSSRGHEVFQVVSLDDESTPVTLEPYPSNSLWSH